MSERVLFGKETRFNAKYSMLWVLSVLIVFPCMMIRNPYDYTKSRLAGICGAGKDVFYRFLNNDSLDWRRIANHITIQLWRRVEARRECPGVPRCAIIDDTDYPKRGIHAEKIGRVFSHVSHGMILGFKSLVLAISDGKSQMVIDHELVGEPGRKGTHSLSEKEAEGRYEKEGRAKDSPAAERIGNYAKSKIELLKDMVRRAIKNGYRFDYLLADSWFACREILQFITTRRIGCHFLGMIKMGEKSLRFSFERKCGGERFSSKAIISKLSSRKGAVKTSRLHKCSYLAVDAFVDGIAVRLFYVRSSKRAPWCGIITTDSTLDFNTAYRIYSMRWSIEVIFYAKLILMESSVSPPLKAA